MGTQCTSPQKGGKGRKKRASNASGCSLRMASKKSLTLYFRGREFQSAPNQRR